MPDASLDFQLPFGDRVAQIHARPDDDGGWAVSTEVDGREIASDYCPNWRRVERFRARMQQWLKVAEASGVRKTSAT
jgi:hypothetical protein